jgi:DNA-binding FadR family transcriptional regulator
VRRKFEEIAEHIELSIFSERMSVGDKIPSERELMNQFGVGRSTVREAMFSMQRKGLLRAAGSRRAGVATGCRYARRRSLRIRASYPLSAGWRPAASERAHAFRDRPRKERAKQATRDELKILREALDANGNAVDQPTFVLTGLTFHDTLAMISHNPIFTSIHRTLMGCLSGQRSLSARAGATSAEIFAQHRAIYDAIHARDTAAAEDAMETHRATVARYYCQAMSSADEGVGRETATT